MDRAAMVEGIVEVEARAPCWRSTLRLRRRQLGAEQQGVAFRLAAQRSANRRISAMPGAALPPRRQPNVSPMSCLAASTVVAVAGRSGSGRYGRQGHERIGGHCLQLLRRYPPCYVKRLTDGKKPR